MQDYKNYAVVEIALSKLLTIFKSQQSRTGVYIHDVMLVIQLPKNSWKQEHTVDTRHLSPLPQCREPSYIVLELFR